MTLQMYCCIMFCVGNEIRVQEVIVVAVIFF